MARIHQEKTAGDGAVPREFNYLPELKWSLMRFKLDSSFSVSQQKLGRKMNGAVQC